MNFENVSILVPYKKEDKQSGLNWKKLINRQEQDLREINWNWILERYKMLMPEAEICIGECKNIPFSRSEAINNAAMKATRDIFIIIDADITFDIEEMKSAINMLSQYKLVIPYSKLLKLTDIGTQNLIAKKPDIEILKLNIPKDDYNIYYDSSKKNSYETIGGVNIIRRETFIECGGFDERFRGWGREDDAFVHVIKYLYGNYGRTSNMTAYHLYHLEQPIIDTYLQANTNLLIGEYQYYNCKNINSTIRYKRNQKCIQMMKNKII